MTSSSAEPSVVSLLRFVRDFRSIVSDVRACKSFGKRRSWDTPIEPVLTKISRTAFYTRKVKFTSETFGEKFQSILDGFPRLQDIHPFRKIILL